MGYNFKEKESNQARIERWRNTGRDAFGLFTGVPNQEVIEPQLKYYGEYHRATYDYQGRKEKLKNEEL